MYSGLVLVRTIVQYICRSSYDSHPAMVHGTSSRKYEYVYSVLSTVLKSVYNHSVISYGATAYTATSSFIACVHISISVLHYSYLSPVVVHNTMLQPM
jgi:hypothetical protein